MLPAVQALFLYQLYLSTWRAIIFPRLLIHAAHRSAHVAAATLHMLILLSWWGWSIHFWLRPTGMWQMLAPWL